MTGQPDFATVTVTYVPGPSIVELKSLKLYLWTYRDVGRVPRGRHQPHPRRPGGRHRPRRMTVHTDWNVRGGIHTTVEATYP